LLSFSQLYDEEVYSDPLGKHDVKISNSIMMDYDKFLGYFVKNLHPFLPESIKQRWNSTNLNHFAKEVIINMPPPRTEYYLKTDNNEIRKDVIAFGSDMYFKLGFNQVYTHNTLMFILAHIYSYLYAHSRTHTHS